MNYGYIRPLSEAEQHRRQYEELNKIEEIVLFEEAHPSPKERTELERLLDVVKEGDAVFTFSLYTLADSTRQLLDITKALTERGVTLHFLAIGMDTKPASAFSFHSVLEELAQFQSEAISEKTKMGLLEAQKKGNNAGRPKKSKDKILEAIAMYQSKNYSLEEIKEQTGISKSTLYRNLEN